MRIIFIQPPPWKLAQPGQPPYTGPLGQPQTGADVVTDPFYQVIPFGLLSLAAQSMAKAHHVSVVNLSAFAWDDVVTFLDNSPADIFAITAITSNRRGLSAVADYAKTRWPSSLVVAGGPHVSALPLETLSHIPAIDCVVIGEGERTFEELIHRYEAGRSLYGLAGAAVRHNGAPVLGPKRARIRDLDSLVSPLRYFDTPVILSSRGCPGHCTFCGSKALWGNTVRFNSPGYTLDMIETAVRRHGRRVLAIKDDTFTVNKARAMAVCQGILERKLNLLWSCDARVDNVDEELLIALRKSGCASLSFGVESASPTILQNIGKRINTERILHVTRLAQKYGFHVHYYMMMGNQGETLETFRQSVEFVQTAKPDTAFYCNLCIYPGTPEYERLRTAGLSPEIFFSGDFAELNVYLGNSADKAQVYDLYHEHCGASHVAAPTLEQRVEVAHALPNLHAAHLDLATSCMQAHDAHAARVHAKQALEMGHPLPHLCYNVLAAAMAALHKYNAARGYLLRAKRYTDHPIIEKNLHRLNAQHNDLDPVIPVDVGFGNTQPIMPGSLSIVRYDQYGKPQTVTLGPKPSPVMGHLETITPTISGWAVNTDDPTPLVVEIDIDGSTWSIVADLQRPDVKAVVGGSGRCGFVFMPPASSLRNCPQKVGLFIPDHPGASITGTPRKALLAGIIGYLDELTENSLSGWAIQRPETNAPMTIRALLDGVPAGQTVTDVPRNDVNQLHGTNGNPGFILPLTNTITETHHLTVLAGPDRTVIFEGDVERRPSGSILIH
ncbi:B12-binding domain-containing radical SAM protein [Desulfovibrio inopinatus]|uniref:B12-binding domain-containing radical SAM protein n=1 Tax=Desulfovibrio inopinatus TaxID=102109 RepID=UPI0003F80F76|nr:radical SAM protein [Desulfovibrio inopinatus]